MPGCPAEAGCARGAGHRLSEWELEGRELCEVSFWGRVDSGDASAGAKAGDDVAGS